MRKVVFDIETRNDFGNSSFDPAKLDISMVCVYDSGTGTYDSFLEGELSRLWPIIEQADMLIGYNSDHFDIPLLNRYYPGDLSRIKSLDLLKEVKNALGRRLRLDGIAEATLGKHKIGHGADAVRWWREGEIEKIRAYCLEDVKLTKELYEYALQNGKLKYKDLGQVREIKLDTSKWEEKRSSGMTHSLPF
ncbi:MAG TPA: ribonuclease H-like domain-containing protein [Candidatus Paceibacterota bacterium]